MTAESLADLAVGALLEEVALYPKPGLVSPVDSGSHSDMDAGLLRSSARALRPAFVELASARGAQFSDLAEIGLRAERAMMDATGGVNTHRGAIFAIGLLVAAASAAGRAEPATIRSHLIDTWGADLRAHCRGAASGGARGQAAAGFPAVFEVGAPRFFSLLESGVPRRDAAIEVLFALIAVLDDTNLMRRGGEIGRSYSRERAAGFLADGGVRRKGWRAEAETIHREFVAKRLSPGGAADMLAATLFLQGVCRLARGAYGGQLSFAAAPAGTPA